MIADICIPPLTVIAKASGQVDRVERLAVQQRAFADRLGDVKKLRGFFYLPPEHLKTRDEFCFWSH